MGRSCWILCLFWACSSPTPPAPPGEASRAAVPGDAPGGAPSGEPAGRWARSPGTEPHPEARALYRRAVQLVHEGKLPEAEALFSKISEIWGDSRFAARLRTPGLSEHLLAQAAAMSVGLLAVAAYAGLVDLGKP